MVDGGIKMTKKEVKDYLNNYVFKLKNYEKTKEKWEHYKEHKWKQVKKELSSPVLLLDDIEDLASGPEHMYFKHNYQYPDRPTLNKSNVRSLASLINRHTRHLHELEIQQTSPIEMTNTEVQGMATRLYIERYKQINNQMKTALKRVVASINWKG
jgi:glutaredoxin